MRHKHYNMIVAKAKNTELVVFVKYNEAWQEVSSTDEVSCSFYSDCEYFLCLPKHAEAVLAKLNGTEWQFCKDVDWIDSNFNQFNVWSDCWWYMCDSYESRIKPKKEKRWIVLQYDQDLKDWCTEDGTLYKTVEDAEDNRRYGQLAEIEVEVF